ncbi:hypothetical protein BDZ45DRAFT_456023 [Acephala macrosclerotiorum]|nr:hypothetical protein BDZ45DRAFT_456023 [Acephala macrosclerotiorum]
MQNPSSPELKAKCVCDLEQITAQLSSEIPSDRFQCLAYERDGRSPIQHRCEKICAQSVETAVTPQCFDRARSILQQGGPINSKQYTTLVIRILFCGKHSGPGPMKRWEGLLLDHWKGTGTREELALLDALRKALLLPLYSLDHRPNLLTTSSPPLLSNNQANTTPPLLDAGRSRSVPHGNAQSRVFVGSSSASSGITRRLFVPGSASSHTSQSTGANSRVHERDEVTVNSAGNRTPPPDPPVASDDVFGFDCPRPHGIALALRPVKDEGQDLESSRSIFGQDDSPPLASTPPVSIEGVSHAVREETPPSPLLASSKPIVPDWKVGGDDCDFSTIHELLLTPPRPPMRSGSKDDTFLDQLSRVTAKMTSPSLESATRSDSPERESDVARTASHSPIQVLPVYIDRRLRTLIKKNFVTEGYVYVLRAPNNPLVKIGKTTDVDKRVHHLERTCGMKLEIIPDYDDTAHKWYDRIEELAQLELANFQQKFQCKKCGTAHHEWFAVPEDVALSTVRRWRRFIRSNPYHKNGVLLDHWIEMLDKVIWQQPEEKYDDHKARGDRWDRWIDEGIRLRNA